MNILVIGHNQVIPHNRSRWLRFAELYSESRVSVIAPRTWHNDSYGKTVEFTVAPEEHRNYQVIPINVFYPGSGRYFYRSLSVPLRQIQPDIIWVYNDLQGFVFQQIVFLRNLYTPKSKIVCCTSTNVPVPLDRFDKRLRYQYALRNVAAFSTGTQEVIKKLRSEGAHQPILHKVVTGADERHWHPGTEDELKSQLGLKGFVVGFVGRHELAKGLPVLISALEGLEGEWSFLSLGDGPFKEEAQGRINAIGHSSYFAGYIPREQTPIYYRCMDVLVVASRQVDQVRDPSPVVIMEAGLSGVVTIGSDIAGIPELVGEVGFIIPEGDVSHLVENLSHLMNRSEMRKNLSKKTRERALELFATSSIAKDTYLFLQNLLLNTNG